MDLAKLRERLINEEGRLAVRYFDTRQVPTIGVGFNLARPDARRVLTSIGADFDAVLGGEPLTEHQIDLLLDQSLIEAATNARCLSVKFDELPDAVQSVLVDLVFNMGAVGVSKFVLMLAAINRHDWSRAAAELRSSLWYRQVGNRGPALVAMLESQGGAE